MSNILEPWNMQEVLDTDNALKQENKAINDNIRASLEVSSGMTMQGVADSVPLSKSLNVSQDTVLNSPSFAKNENLARDIEKSPLMKKWAAEDAKRAAIVREDFEGIKNMFSSVEAFNNMPKEADDINTLEAKALWGDKNAQDEIKRQEGYSEDEIKYGTIRQNSRGALEQIPLLLDEGIHDVAKSIVGTINMFQENFARSEFAKEADITDSVLESLENSRQATRDIDANRFHLPASDTFIGGLGQDIVKTVPQVAAQALSYLTGGKFLSLLAMGSQVSGSVYNDMIDNGVGVNRATITALGSGVAGGLLEQAGFNKILGAFGKKGTSNMLTSFLKGGLGEGSTEGIQNIVQEGINVYGTAERDDISFLEGVRKYVGEFPETLKESAYEGLIGFILGGSMGASGTLASDKRKERADNFATSQKELHKIVEASKIKQMSPEYTASALRGAGIRQTVTVSAQDIVTDMFQSAPESIEKMGFNIEDMQEMADLGQYVEIPLAELQANLDGTEFDKWIEFVHADTEAMSMTESQDLDITLFENDAKIQELVEKETAMLYSIDEQKARLMSEATDAVSQSPNLIQQIASTVNPDGSRLTINNYVNDWLNGHVMPFANRNQVDPADFLSRINIGYQDINNMANSVQQQDNALKDFVYGSIDSARLKVDYPFASKELSRKYGRRIFQKNGQGVDELAQEAVSMGLLPYGTDGEGLLTALLNDKKANIKEDAYEGTLFQSQEQETASIQEVRSQYENITNVNDLPINIQEKIKVLDDKDYGVPNIGENDRNLDAVRKRYAVVEELEVEAESLRLGSLYDELSTSKDSAIDHLVDIGVLSGTEQRVQNFVFGDKADDTRKNTLLIREGYRSVHNNITKDGKYSIFGRLKDVKIKYKNDGNTELLRIVSHPDFKAESGIEDTPAEYTQKELSAAIKKHIGSNKQAFIDKKLADFVVDRNDVKKLAKSMLYDARDNFMRDRAGLFTEVLDSLGYSSKITNSNISDSVYLSANNGTDNYKIRFSDHADIHGGNDLNLNFQDSAKQNVSDVIDLASIDNSDDFMKAPNGKDTLLNEREWLMVRTPEFKNWFGDWETDPANASKVVDANGEPLVVYHTTSEKFDAFDISKSRSGVELPAFFFSPNKTDWQDMGNITHSLFLNIKNPLTKSYSKYKGISDYKQIREALVNDGYDGAFSVEDGYIDEFLAFSPNQIKSTSNLGAFNPQDDRILYQFMGEQGAANLDKAEEATTRLDNLGVAREMETAGKDEKTIKMATGWERGADGKWRYEVVDGTMIGELDVTKYHPLNSVFVSEDLYKSYPQLKEFKVRYAPDYAMVGKDGELDKARNTITLNKGNNYFAIEETLIHEIQHAIQGIEGFAKGGSPEQFKNVNEIRKLLETQQEELESEYGFEDWATSLALNDAKKNRELLDAGRGYKGDKYSLLPMYEEFAKEKGLDSYFPSRMHRFDKEIQSYKKSYDPVKSYNNLAGETEARNTQTRLSMTPEQRRESLARETEDVAREDQIILYQGIMGKKPLGSYTPYGTKHFITLMNGANLSTIIHESAHMFQAEIDSLIESGMASDELLQSKQHLDDWLSFYDNDENLNAYYDKTLKKNKLGRFHGIKFNDLSEQWVDDVRGIAKSEMFARGFEAYTREGKAPSEELDSMFGRFKKWLTSIYKNVASLDVQLNDDVRMFFSRIISTDAEIDSNMKKFGITENSEALLDKMGLNDDEKIRYRDLFQDVREESANKLQKSKDKAIKDKIAPFKEQARKEIEESPVFNARTAMRKEPLDMDSIIDELGAAYYNKVRLAMPGVFKKGGQAPDAFAYSYGFENLKTMLETMLATPNRKDYESQRVSELIAESDLNFDPMDYIQDSKKLQDLLELEFKKIAEKTKNQEDIKASGVSPIVIREVAKRSIEGMTVRAASNVGKYRSQVRYALNSQKRAITKGDFKTASEENQRARINLEMVIQSENVKNLRERFINQNANAHKHKSMDKDAQFVIQHIGASHGLRPVNYMLSNGRGKNEIEATNFALGWVDKQNSDGIFFTWKNEDVFIRGAGVLINDMQVTALIEADNAVKSIMVVERNERTIRKGVELVALQDAVDAISSSLLKNNKYRVTDSINDDPLLRRATDAIHSSHSKIEMVCRLADGDVYGGEMSTYIYEQVTAADDVESVRNKKESETINEILGLYTLTEMRNMSKVKIQVDAVNRTLTKEEILSVALNSGNDGNMSRLRSGFGWTDPQIEAITQTLDKRDWEFVNAVWSHIESFKKESFALEKEMTGLEPKEVEGDYYPIKYNPKKGTTAYELEQKAKSQALYSGVAPATAQTAHGHLKVRSEGKGLETPLLLKLSVYTNHVVNVVHDLAFRRTIRDVAKILKNRTFISSIDNTLGSSMRKQFNTWLADIANDKNVSSSIIDKGASWARNGVSVMYMGLKATTAFTQTWGLTHSVELIGAKYVGVGIKQVSQHPLSIADTVRDLSPMMQGRITSYNREIQESLSDIKENTPLKAMSAWVRKASFAPMGFMQFYTVDLPTWLGAYQKGLVDFEGNELKAIKFADSMVRLSQGSGKTKDLSGIQRGAEIYRLFTMFYSHFNTLYNLFARAKKKANLSPMGIIATANSALLLWLIPAILSEFTAGRGPEEDEDFSNWALKKAWSYPLGTVVGLRDVTGSVSSGFGYKLSPSSAVPESAIKWLNSIKKAIGEDGELTDVIEPTLDLAGFVLHLPVGGVKIPLENMLDFYNGEDNEFYVRDLFFVKPQDRR